MTDGSNQISNTGTIVGGDGLLGGVGVYLSGGETYIDNEGTISGGTGSGSVVAYGIHNLATITSLINTGTITGGVRNDGTITTLTNQQAGLSFSGTAPTNYNVVITSSTAGDYGQLVVENSTSWGMSDLTFGIADGYVVDVNATYEDVIQASGTTTFDSTASKTARYRYNGAVYVFSLDYDGTSDWDLAFDSIVTFEAAAEALANTPAGPAAQALDANSTMSDAFGSLTTDEELSTAATQSMPLLTAGSQATAGQAISSLNRVIDARTDVNRGMSSGDEFAGDRKMWVKPFGSSADQDDKDGVSGYDALTKGMAFGLDGSLSETTQIGLAFAYANTSVSGNSSVAPHSADVDLYQLTGYGSAVVGKGVDVSYQLGLGQIKTSGQRDILLAGVSADSAYDSLAGTAAIDASRSYQRSEKTTFTPSIRAEYKWIKDEAYTETGADVLNLAVDGRTSEELILAVDGKVTQETTAGAMLSANLGIGYDALQSQNSITAAFAGAPTASFTTYGLDQTPWMVRGGIGLSGTAENGMEINARYDMEYRNGFNNRTASMNLRWQF